MPKRTNALDRINIASPCSADWDEMVGNHQVRFCQHCSLYVHDLAKITRKDALKLVAASNGKLCVRYQRRPDGTVQTATHAQPVAQIKRRLSRIAAGAFTATLSLAPNAAAQSRPVPERETTVIIKPATISTIEQPAQLDGPSASLVGTVTDPNEAVVPAARVTLINEETGQQQSTETNDEGAYQFQALEAGTYKVSIESPGFRVFQQEKVILQSGNEQRVDATLEVGSVGGAIVVMPETPLINAIWEDNLTEVKNLLAEGVDVNVLDKNVDSTALAEAVARGNLDLVKALLHAGADPNLKNSSGRTALMNLDEDGSAEIVRALVDAGAKINLRDEDGDSALHVAAAIEKPDVLKSLLDTGAKINARNKDGKTALMIAAEEDRLENVKALLLAGAKVNQRDNDGATALKYAQDSGNGQIIGTLIAYGAVE